MYQLVSTNGQMQNAEVESRTQIVERTTVVFHNFMCYSHSFGKAELEGHCKSWTLDSGLDRGLDYGMRFELNFGLKRHVVTTGQCIFPPTEIQ